MHRPPGGSLGTARHPKPPSRVSQILTGPDPRRRALCVLPRLGDWTARAPTVSASSPASKGGMGEAAQESSTLHDLKPRPMNPDRYICQWPVFSSNKSVINCLSRTQPYFKSKAFLFGSLGIAYFCPTPSNFKASQVTSSSLPSRQVF